MLCPSLETAVTLFIAFVFLDSLWVLFLIHLLLRPFWMGGSIWPLTNVKHSPLVVLSHAPFPLRAFYAGTHSFLFFPFILFSFALYASLTLVFNSPIPIEPNESQVKPTFSHPL